MSEDEWLTCSDPAAMLRQLLGKVSDRKLRLFASACVRRVIDMLSDKPISKKTLEFAERYADGLATRNELHGRAWGPAGDAYAAVLWDASAAAEISSEFAVARVRLTTLGLQPGEFLTDAVTELVSPEEFGWANAAGEDERLVQAGLLRDIFGNPFRPVAFDPRWLTADVVGLARGIYEDRAFDRLPLLADALMDAGCDSDDVLSHCKGEGPHVRGCWVVDRVLGKE